MDILLLNDLWNIDWQQAIFVVLGLILVESLLSVDNAAVLATMVMDLPKEQRAKALRYGIIGAYVFRGLAMIFAWWLINIWWLKPLGGAYLLYLAIAFFVSKTTPEQDEITDKKSNWLYRNTLGLLGPFWATVALVELMDMAFSIDNVLAAAAYTDNIVLICIGVFIGILAMRFVAQGFVKLMERYPFLEHAAFVVIAILGVKLMLSLYTHFYKDTHALAHFLHGEIFDLIISISTVLVFVIPIATSYFFNFPKNAISELKEQEMKEEENEDSSTVKPSE